MPSDRAVLMRHRLGQWLCRHNVTHRLPGEAGVCERCGRYVEPAWWSDCINIRNFNRDSEFRRSSMCRHGGRWAHEEYGR